MNSPSSSDEMTAALNQIDSAVQNGRLSADGAANLRRWLTDSAFGRYQPRLLELLASEEFDRLDNLFWEVISFGTGGRRGPMGELGTATINERTIAESAHGLAVYLKQQHPDRVLQGVVAYDTRNRSREFAQLTATTLAAHGIKMYYFEEPRSTPELSFAVRRLNCDAGVMITASHNPPSDNGFKAYWSHGGQVLAPHDRGIIECVYQAGEIPTFDFDRAIDEGLIETVGEGFDQEYISEVARLSLSAEREVSALFTPLHGVGETSVYRVLDAAGFSGVEVFEPQRQPDGNFPNVPDQLPNPERTEVFQPAIERAEQTGAELILASDPDADRLGIVVKDHSGRFLPLSGNRIGALLVDYVLRKRQAAGTLSADHYVVETLVTTPLIGAIARSYGVRIIDDLLVGFKYIAETMDREGPDRFVFGVEESLGYLAGEYCRDKDAAVAALYIMELAAELRREGRTLLDRLDELFVEHGYYLEGQISEVCKGPRGKEQIEQIMRAFREKPPTDLAGFPLARVRDYGEHEIRILPENRPEAELPHPSGNLLFFDSAPGEQTFSLAVRPSGTEPKIKFYVFAQSACRDPGALSEVKEQTDSMLGQIQESLSAWIQSILQSTAESDGSH